LRPRPLAAGGSARLAGAEYVAEPAWTPHAVTDGNLVSGQQNYSAQVTADAVMKVLGA
jgi:putative intracellular protease/amidase